MSQFKRILITVLAAAVALTAGCGNQRSEDTGKNGFDKELSRLYSYEKLDMEEYQYKDYKMLAMNYDSLVFDTTLEGEFLPLIWMDKTNESFGMPAYVGDGRMNQDGAQEAVTCISAVLSATLIGIDKTDVDGVNYVSMLNTFYNEDERIIVNNPSNSSATTSMWYLLYPAILYTQVSAQYPEETKMSENVLSTIESWYQAYTVMYQEGIQTDFDYTGFNFLTNMPYRNDIWSEPDCAVGIAWLMDYGYTITQDPKYLEAAIQCLNYVEQYFGSPLYEILQYFGPVLNAKMNALYGTSYDMGQSYGRIFDGTSIPRGGWGSFFTTWGDYNVSGLFGSTTDGGGYAFSMNSFAAAGAIIPAAKYDTRYAQAIGEWVLHLIQNARYFFYDEIENDNQSTTYLDCKDSIPEVILHTLPYEGIRYYYNGKTPWFGGDPTVYGWAVTDFSLYSGAHIGVLASRIAPTNQDGILKISLNEQETKDRLPFYLLYNPYQKEKEVTYSIAGESAVDLYNTVTNQYLATAVSGEVTLTITAGEACVIAELPAGVELVNQNGALCADGQFVSAQLCSLKILNLSQNETVSGKVKLEIELFSNYEDSIKEAVLTIGDEKITFEDTITIDTTQYGNGNKNIEIAVETVNGHKEQDSIRLKIKN